MRVSIDCVSEDGMEEYEPTLEKYDLEKTPTEDEFKPFNYSIEVNLLQDIGDIVHEIKQQIIVDDINKYDEELSNCNIRLLIMDDYL
jgi:hypothetical protein